MFFEEWQRSQAAPRPAQGHPGRLSEVASLRRRSHEFPTLFPGPAQGFQIFQVLPRVLLRLPGFTGLLGASGRSQGCRRFQSTFPGCRITHPDFQVSLGVIRRLWGSHNRGFLKLFSRSSTRFGRFSQAPRAAPCQPPARVIKFRAWTR